MTTPKDLPDLSLPSTSGQTLALNSLAGRKLVLYFYPKDSTPGCTLEGQDFSRLYPDFQAAGAEVLGVSRDSLRAHENFKCKQSFVFELLSDADEALCSAFGVIREKKMYGKTVRGIERSTFLFDAGGKLVREWRGVKVAGHAEEVLQAVRGI